MGFFLTLTHVLLLIAFFIQHIFRFLLSEVSSVCFFIIKGSILICCFCISVFFVIALHQIFIQLAGFSYLCLTLDIDLESVSFAASLAFLSFFSDCQRQLIIRNDHFAVFSSSSAITEITFAGLNAFSIRIAGFSSQLMISIFSPRSSSTIVLTHTVHADTCSDRIYIRIVEPDRQLCSALPASLAILLISTKVPSFTSGYFGLKQTFYQLRMGT